MLEMTEQEFFDELRASPRDWFLNRTGAIRRHSPFLPYFGQKDNCCPWLQVYGAPNKIGAYTAEQIFQAADSPETIYPELRAKLLEACGLAPEPTV